MTNIAKAWLISRADGLVLGFTDHDQEMQFDGVRFRPDSGMTARAVAQASGLSVDNSEAEGALSADAITGADLMAGRWDGAGLRMWEVDWRDVSNRRLVFRGSLGEVSHSAGRFRAELRGLSEPLAAPAGRVFHPRCSARLGDSLCGLRVSDPALSGEFVVAQVEGGRNLRFAGAGGFEPGWFARGVLRVLTGAAKGLEVAIKGDIAVSSGGREVELWHSPAVNLQPGNRVLLIAGCDKRAGTCRLKFGNFMNFRGFPHMPKEDWLLTPKAGSGNG